METNQSLLHNKSGNGVINNLKASKNTITDLNLVQNDDSTLPPRRRIHLRHQTGNKAATGRSNRSWDSWQTSSDTPNAQNNFSYTVVAQSRCSLVVRVYSRILTSMQVHGSNQEAHVCFSPPQKKHASSSSRNVVHLAEPDTTPMHSILTPFPDTVFLQSEQPCGDQRPQQSGALTEIPRLTERALSAIEPDPRHTVKNRAALV